MDDFCPSRHFRGEHGLSLHIETDSARLLFDTGQTGAFLENADRLGIDLGRLEAVVLSHGHYDHGGGLPALYDRLRDAPPPLFAGRGFSSRRYSRGASADSDIGLPRPCLPERIGPPTEVDAITSIAPGVHVLPRAERIHDSRIDPRFAVGDGDARRPDLFEDELSLVVSDEYGIVVITGCAHRGIVNIVEAALRAFPGLPLRAIVGGFHLASCGDEELAGVARALAELAPQRVLCAHCTGLRGFASLSAALGNRLSWIHCGAKIRL
jgi:7,8-dihydropterin-6-yl-methyl-4-(beta-D-ribofuranosyl)aminobenzene 5'-phosphate synthase